MGGQSGFFKLPERLCYSSMMGKKDIISKEAIKRIAVDLATILLELKLKETKGVGDN